MKGGLLLFLKRKLAEQTIILISISKWILLAAVVGAMIGISTTLFLKLLNWSIAFAGQYRYFFLLMPVAFHVSVLMIKYLAPQAEGHGTEKIIDAVHRHSGKIRLAVVPVKLVTTVITIALGGSAGKEGPAAQIGAALASGFSDLLKFDDSDRKKLVICGISAGFGAVFGTPISGAVFGIEVLFAGFMMYDVLLPSFIAAITASVAASALGMVYFYNPFGDVPAFSLFFFLKLIAAGVLFGVVSMLLIEMMDICHKLAGKLRPLLRPLVGGVLLIGLTFLFSRDYLGLGVSTIESTLTGVQIVWYAFLLKIVFTAVTLGFGGSGHYYPDLFYRRGVRQCNRAAFWCRYLCFCRDRPGQPACRLCQHPHQCDYYVHRTVRPPTGPLCGGGLHYQLLDDRPPQCLSQPDIVHPKIGVHPR